MEIDPLIVGLIVIISTAVGLAFYLDRRRTRKRQEDIRTAAEAMGLEFQAFADPAFENRVAMFNLFDKGHSKKILNIVVGEVPDFEIVVFDYHYSVGRGKNQKNHRRAVALIESTNLYVPAFTLRPESMFDRLGSIFGLQDIDFDSHPLFSKMFVLKGENEAQVREFFDDSVLSLLQKKPKVCLEANEGRMILYYAVKPPKENQVKALFSEALEVHTILADRARECPIKYRQELNNELEFDA